MIVVKIDNFVMNLLQNFFMFFGYRHKNLLYNIIVRNLKLKYRKSYLGILWTMIVPAANATVYFFVFNQIMKVQLPNQLLILLSGLMLWIFFSSSVVQGMESIVANHSLLNKTPIPPHVFPLSEVITLFINFLFSVPILLFIQVQSTGFNFFGLCILVLSAIILFVISYSLALILSYGFAFLRDLRHLVGILIQIWFYLTPIIYLSKMVPEKYSFIIYINPLAALFENMHQSFALGLNVNFNLLLISLLWSFGLLLVSFICYSLFNKKIVEYI
jgi:lipopolysaccharide transport system permease protein